MNTDELNQIAAELRATAASMQTLVASIPDADSRTPVPGEDWTITDVVGHLIHGEKTDWLPRCRLILAGGDQPFEPFDREAMKNDPEDSDLASLLHAFTSLREMNVDSLEKLDITGDDMNRTGIHPEFGRVTLNQLLHTWVAHDLSHLAQVARIRAGSMAARVGPWKAYLPLLDRTVAARRGS